MEPNKNYRKKITYWIILFVIAFLPVILSELYFYFKFMNEFGNRGYTKELLAKGRLQNSHYCGYEQIPNTISLKSGFRQNNHGFRDEDDTSPQKKENEYRIFILGGSGAIGQGAMQEFIWISGQQEYASKYTISAYLEEKLNAEFPQKQVEVINAAVSGYKVHHELSLYLSKIRSLNPDLIILIDGYNDMFFPLDGKFYVNDFDREAWDNNRYKTDFTYRYGMYLMSKSYTFFYIGKNIFTSKFQYDEKIYQKWLNDTRTVDTVALNTMFDNKFSEIKYGMDDVFDRYEMFKQVCAIDSVDILFCPQPILTLKPNKTDVEKALNNYLLDELSEEEKMCYYSMYNYYLNRFDQTAGAENLNYLNLQKEINKSDKQIFVDYAHLSFFGNAFIAELLKNKIVEMDVILK